MRAPQSGLKAFAGPAVSVARQPEHGTFLALNKIGAEVAGVQHLCQRALCRRLVNIDEAQEVPCGSLLWLPILLCLKGPEQNRSDS